jgi:SAM-dependent methyltransferase
VSLFTASTLTGPVLDLACGNGHNGIFLATKGLQVMLADVSLEALKRAEILARQEEVRVTLWQVDLEHGDDNPLSADYYSAILVFRYLHRPLMPFLKKALQRAGLILYETFTVDQPQFGKPRNPAFLLKPGELAEWFKDWSVIYQFEGIVENPKRAIAQIVCRKP